jgi:hypothetical protein
MVNVSMVMNTYAAVEEPLKMVFHDIHAAPGARGTISNTQMVLDQTES